MNLAWGCGPGNPSPTPNLYQKFPVVTILEAVYAKILAVLTYRSIHGTPSRVSPVLSTWHQDDGCGLLSLEAPLDALAASSRSTARSTLYSRQTGVPSCRRQHVERPSIPHHICTVTRGLQTASQDFPLLSFLPRHPDMTYLSLLIITVVFFSFFLAFPVDLAITDIIQVTLNTSMTLTINFKATTVNFGMKVRIWYSHHAKLCKNCLRDSPLSGRFVTTKMQTLTILVDFSRF